MGSLGSGVALALTGAMVLSLYRVLRGPTVFDRLTGLGLLGTKTLLLLLVVGALMHRLAFFVDIALAYALLSFLGALVLAKYFERKEGEPL
ncbi:MAG: hypothetical protein KatS3mg131_0994 [Candidatus Tectimicrobiota bacterium]|nr:MAG: hypothetical protein KatS3mg131_0994 [Candidatus Tectomicrobia bacterium]